MKQRALLIVLLLVLVSTPAISFGKEKQQNQKKGTTSTVHKKTDTDTDEDEDVGDVMKSVTLAIASPAASPKIQSVRALSLTDEAKNTVLDKIKQADFFAFAKAPHGNAGARVNRISLNAEAFDFTSKTQTAALRAFLKKAHEAGMTVEFLTGKDYWVQDSSGFTSAMKRCDRLMAFNAGSASGAETFDGMHYDIRPYLLGEWRNNTSAGKDEFNDKYEKNYIKILTSCNEKLQPAGLSLNVSVPTWYAHQVHDIWTPLTASNSPVDMITVLNFFDEEKTFLYGYGGANKTGGIGPNLSKAGGIPFIFSANIEEENPTSVTFREEGIGAMETVFKKATDTFGTHAQFAGVAVQNYTAYKQIKMGEVAQPVTVVPPTPVPEPIPVPVPQPTPVPTPVPVPVPAPTPTPVPQPAPTPVAAPTLQNVRAMWIWSESSAIVNTASAQEEFFSFVKAPKGDASARINRIFLNGDSFDYTSNSTKTALRAFLKKAHDNGLAVEFLTGNSKWVLSGQEGNAITRCERMIAFNAGSSDPKERYDGMHLDIEPYLLAEWKLNTGSGTDGYNDELQSNYMSILNACKQKMKESGQKVTLSVDIPTWFSSSVSDIWKPLNAENTPVDYLTFMNYFDTEATFLYGYGGSNKSGGVGPNLAKGGNLPMVFGAETIHLDPVSITFFEEGFAAMENVFDRAEEVFAKDARFAGTAVHHYRTLKELKP